MVAGAAAAGFITGLLVFRKETSGGDLPAFIQGYDLSNLSNPQLLFSRAFFSGGYVWE